MFLIHICFLDLWVWNWRTQRGGYSTLRTVSVQPGSNHERSVTNLAFVFRFNCWVASQKLELECKSLFWHFPRQPLWIRSVSCASAGLVEKADKDLTVDLLTQVSWGMSLALEVQMWRFPGPVLPTFIVLVTSFSEVLNIQAFFYIFRIVKVPIFKCFFPHFYLSIWLGN